MKKFLFLIFGIYAVLGLVCCVFACSTYFHAQELEFSAQKAARESVRQLDSLTYHSKLSPDTSFVSDY